MNNNEKQPLSVSVPQGSTVRKLQSYCNNLNTAFTQENPEFITLLKGCIKENPDSRTTIDKVIKKIEALYPHIVREILNLFRDINGKSKQAAVYNNDAIIAVTEKNYQSAEELLNLAISMNPDDIIPRYNLAALKVRLGLESRETLGKIAKHATGYDDEQLINRAMEFTITKHFDYFGFYNPANSDDNNNAYAISADYDLFTCDSGKYLLVRNASNNSNICFNIFDRDEIVALNFDGDPQKCYASKPDGMLAKNINNINWFSKQRTPEMPDNYKIVVEDNEIVFYNGNVEVDRIKDSVGKYCFFELKTKQGIIDKFIAVINNKGIIDTYQVGKHLPCFIYDDGNFVLPQKREEEMLSDEDHGMDDCWPDDATGDFNREELLPEIVERNDNIRARLLSRVKGQDHVVHAFCDAVFDAEAFLKYDNKRKKLVRCKRSIRRSVRADKCDAHSTKGQDRRIPDSRLYPLQPYRKEAEAVAKGLAYPTKYTTLAVGKHCSQLGSDHSRRDKKNKCCKEVVECRLQTIDSLGGKTSKTHHCGNVHNSKR